MDKMTDSEMLDWLEVQAKEKSRTGISFDYVNGGFRFMRRFFIGEPKKTLRDAIHHAKYISDGGVFSEDGTK